MKAMFHTEPVKVQTHAEQLADRAEKQDINKQLQRVMVLKSANRERVQLVGPARSQQRNQETQTHAQASQFQASLNPVIFACSRGLGLGGGKWKIRGGLWWGVAFGLNSMVTFLAGAEVALVRECTTGSPKPTSPKARCISAGALPFTCSLRSGLETATTRWG